MERLALKAKGGERRLNRASFRWFSLEPYQVATLSPRAWYLELLRRHVAWFHLFDSDEQVDRETVRSILDDPIGAKGTGFKVIDRLPRTPAVRDLTVLEAFRLIELDHPDGQSIIKDVRRYQDRRSKAMQQMLATMKRPRRIVSRYAVSPLHVVLAESSGPFRDLFPVFVSLDAPDEIVLASFKEWLRAKRSGQNQRSQNRPISAELIRTWREFHLLPYIDLMLYCRLVGGIATQALIGELLFPTEEVDTTERVRKVVQPMAVGALDQGFLRSMHNATAGE